MKTIKLHEIKACDCPIEGFKETDNCLLCKFFGGMLVSPGTKTSINVSLVCNK